MLIFQNVFCHFIALNIIYSMNYHFLRVLNNISKLIPYVYFLPDLRSNENHSKLWLCCNNKNKQLPSPKYGNKLWFCILGMPCNCMASLSVSIWDQSTASIPYERRMWTQSVWSKVRESLLISNLRSRLFLCIGHAKRLLSQIAITCPKSCDRRLKPVDTVGNFQRPVFSLAASTYA